VCWMVREGGHVAIRCFGLTDSELQARELDRFQPTGATTLELAPDAAYWLRPNGSGTSQELVATAL
jgi:hypothetical protein